MTTVYAAMESALLVVSLGESGQTDADGEGVDGPDPRIAGGDGDADAPADSRTARRLTDYELQCLAVHPDAPDRAFVGTFDDGLFRSTDRGETWERVGADIAGDRVTAAATNPADPDEVWVGTEPSAVYETTDGGDAWTEREGLTDLPSASEWSFPPRPHTHHVRWIEVDPVEPDRRYVGIEAGALVRTRDRGGTWEDRVPSARRDNHSLATHPEAPDRAWSAAGDGYAETLDGGETWRHPQSGLAHRYCWSVAVDPADPGTVLLSSASGPRQAHTPGRAESYVYRKRERGPGADGSGGGRLDFGDGRSGSDGDGADAGSDGADTGDGRAGAWERADADLPAGEGMLRAELEPGFDAGEFYALCNRGLFRTADAGDSWTRLDVEWPDGFAEQTARGLTVV